MSGTATLASVKLTANDLRRVAEKADGLRGVPLVLVLDDQGFVDVTRREEMKAGQQALLELQTPNNGPGIPGDAKIRLAWRNKVYPDPKGPESPLDDADAVFVSQSAVEKFVLPYYIRYRSGAEVQDLQDKLFKKESVIAAFHIPPSDPKVYEGDVVVMNVEDGSDTPQFELIGRRHKLDKGRIFSQGSPAGMFGDKTTQGRPGTEIHRE